MIKKHLLKTSIISTLILSFTPLATAEELKIVTPKSSFEQAFYDDAKLDLIANLYIRNRAVKNPTTGKYGMGPASIRNQTGLVGLSYKSGYYQDIIGFDFWGSANIKLGHTEGQSEILYYKYSCNNDGKYSPCEKSYLNLSTAALKLKLENETAKFKMNLGYTPINSGTIRSSWGLNPHSFRGFDAALTVDQLTFTYAWADRFKNDWSKSFKRMTTSWHQNGAAGLDNNGVAMSSGKYIDYIHSVGLVYKLDNFKIDSGYGEGKDYRRNWQLQLENTTQLATNTSLVSKFFYQGAKYIRDGVSPVVEPSYEYYATLGFNLQYKDTTWSVGYSQNRAPQTADYNFRLTPWANSDKRDWQATLSQLEDFNASGTHALRLGVSHNFKSMNLPELTIGLAGTYGWHVVSNTAKINSDRDYDGKMKALDLNVKYQVLAGPAKGLSFAVMPALLRSSDTNYKTSRNDIKFVVGYSINLF